MALTTSQIDVLKKTIQDPHTKLPTMNIAKIQENARELLSLVGEDAQRPGLLETPTRMAKFYQEVLSGYDQDPLDHGTAFPSEGHNMVVVKDINFYSLCEHHLVPFFGTASIGYIPEEKILGLSKFGRIVDVFAKRLQVQERLTNEIMQTVLTILEPRGCAIKIEAKHLCMSMRGIKKDDAKTVTTAFSGEFENNEMLRKEFLTSL
jgi:GTP cyclohydrolase I